MKEERYFMTTFEAKAFVPYVTFMEHAKKVAKGRTVKNRPILSTVLHKEDYVAVTDSFRLYLANSVYEGEEKTLDAQTGQEVDKGVFPNVERLVSDKANAKYSHELNVEAAYQALRAIEIAGRLNKTTDRMEILVNYDSVELKTDDITAFDVSYKEGKTIKDGDECESVKLQTKFLKEAVHVLKDAKVERFTLQCFGTNRPIQLEAGNFTALITP